MPRAFSGISGDAAPSHSHGWMYWQYKTHFWKAMIDVLELHSDNRQKRFVVDHFKFSLSLIGICKLCSVAFPLREDARQNLECFGWEDSWDGAHRSKKAFHGAFRNCSRSQFHFEKMLSWTETSSTFYKPLSYREIYQSKSESRMGRKTENGVQYIYRASATFFQV